MKMDIAEILKNPPNFSELCGNDKNLVLIESIENSLKKNENVCSIHAQETLLFCFSCKYSICVECRDLNHKSHSYVNKIDYILDDLQKNKEMYIQLKFDDDYFPNIELLKQNVEQDFAHLKEKIENTKIERLKEIDSFFQNFETYNNGLKEEILKSNQMFNNFCETNKAILSSDAIKHNDAAFILVYNILSKGSSGKSDLDELIQNKKNEIYNYIETIKQANLKFDIILQDLLKKSFSPCTLQTKSSFNLFMNYESKDGSKEKINDDLKVGNTFIPNDKIESVRIDKIIESNEETIFNHLNEFIDKNSLFLDRFLKELKIVRNTNGMHDKYSKGRVYEINLTNNIDSKLFMKAYIKFLERNGENLDNIITLRSMVYLNQNKKENCRSFSGTLLYGTLHSPQCDRQKFSVVKEINKAVTLRKKSDRNKKKKENTMFMTSNKLNETQDQRVCTERNETNSKTIFKNMMDNHRFSPSIHHKSEKSIFTDNPLNKLKGSPFKALTREEMVKKLQMQQSKSQIKEKKMYKNKIYDKMKILLPTESQNINDNPSITENDSIINPTNIKSKLSDNLLRILISSNMKIKNDPIKLINQYLAKNFNLAKLNNFTIKAIFDQIFNHEFAKPIEGKNEIHIFDYKKSKIIKKEKNIIKSTHGCNSFLNGSRYITINDKIYSIGGKDWSQQHNICLFYDINNDSLTRIDDMKNNRAYCSLIASDDEKMIYVIGGDNNKTCEVLNIDTLSWRELPSMNFSRGNPSLYIFKDTFLYVLSGFKGDITANLFEESIERLDISNLKEWEVMQYKNSSCIDMKLAHSGIIPLTIGHILIFGGENSRYKTKCQAIYDLSKNEIFNSNDKLEKIRNDLIMEKKNSNKSN